MHSNSHSATKSKLEYLESFMDKAKSTKKLRIDLMKDIIMLKKDIMMYY